ncbi:MAG: winged helix-turn-helix domain-containing protein [Phycisphaerales bacterium]|nr:winged helix-turn-helix domain-containing protein [Phycisphaerales bacterium]
MRVKEREPGDLNRLEALIAAEPTAKQRERYRMALLAIHGHTKKQIARVLGAPMSVVEEWAYRYRDGGIDAMRAKKQPGRRAILAPERHEEFKARISGAPREADGVCTLRGKDAVRILNEEYGVAYTLNGVYDLLHRLNLSCLTPRPRHEKNDPGR